MDGRSPERFSQRFIQKDSPFSDIRNYRSWRKSYHAEGNDVTPDSIEFNSIQYTAVTADQPAALKDQVNLHCIRLLREVKLLLMVTVNYDEGATLEQTLEALCNNLDSLNEQGVSWKNVCVVVLVDGRNYLHPSMVDYCTRAGLYSPQDVADQVSQPNHNTALHLFETCLILKKDVPVERAFNLPLQTIFAVKERHGGKLSAAEWLYRGFAGALLPRYTLAMDVGVRPSVGSIAHLYTRMESEPCLGAMCGELVFHKSRLHDLVQAAQTLENVIDACMDKPLQSTLGHVTAIPTAFGIYRYEAILGAPLDAYLKGLEPLPSARDTCMHMAAEHVLAWEILVKEKQRYTLAYSAHAKASTEPAAHLVSLMERRRRWLNDSLFALLYCLSNAHRLASTEHGAIRKFGFMVHLFHLLITTVTSWFLVGTVFIAYSLVVAFNFHLLLASALEYGFVFAYVMLGVIQFVCGLGNKAQSLENLYFLCSFVYTGLMLGTVVMMLLNVLNQGYPDLANYIILALVLAHAGCMLLHGKLRVGLFHAAQYLCMLPSLVNVLQVYSWCNIADVGDTRPGATTAKRADRVKAFRAYLCMAWLSSNVLYVNLVLSYDLTLPWAMLVGAGVAFLLGAKTLGSLAYQTSRLLASILRCLTRHCRKSARTPLGLSDGV